jgi:hypothetical protein
MKMVVLLLAAAMPLPKAGTCPSGYMESGGYCAPMTELFANYAYACVRGTTEFGSGELPAEIPSSKPGSSRIKRQLCACA